MSVVDIINLEEIEPLKLKVICSLGWSDEKEKIVILKGKRIGERILKNRYLDKETYEKISSADGKKFISCLPFYSLKITNLRLFLERKCYEIQRLCPARQIFLSNKIDF